MKFIIVLIILLIVSSGIPVVCQQSVIIESNRVLNLDGDGSYLELPPRIFDRLEESTIEVWVQWFDLHHRADIFDFGRDGTEMLLATRSYGNLDFKFNVGPTSHPVRIFNILRTNEWCHIAAVSGSRGMRLYFNGSLVGTNAYKGSFGAIAPGVKNFVGRDNAKGWGGFTTFHGQMDELRVWGVARTQQEIQENMTRSLTGREAGLFGLWNFEDGGARDATTNQHHGILAGKARVISGVLPRKAPAPPSHILRGRVLDSKGNKIKSVNLEASIFIYHDGVLIANDGFLDDQWQCSIVVDDWPEPFDLAVVRGKETGWRTGISKEEIKAGPIDIHMTDQSVSGRVTTADSKPMQSLVVQAIRVLETQSHRIQGLQGRYYGPDEIYSFPDFSFEDVAFPVLKPRIQPAIRQVDPVVNLAKNDEFFGGDGLPENTYVIWNGIIHVTEKSKYTFYVESDGAARLRIDHQRLLNQVGILPSMEDGRHVDLGVGDHSIELEYFHAQGPSRCVLMWSRDGLAKEVVPADHFFSKTSSIVSNLATNSIVTDIHGVYAFVDLQPGKYQLRAQVGHDSIPMGGETVEVKTGRPIRGLDYRLAPFKAGGWKQYTMEHGLPSNDALTIFAAPDGMIWVGTTAGIARFDGDRFVHFTTEQGLLDDTVRSVFRDRDGFMWFGSTKGVSRLNLAANRHRFERFPLDLTDPQDGIRSILQTPDGRIWVAGSRGLAWFDGQTFHACEVSGGPKNPNRMTLGDDGLLWITSKDGGLSSFDGRMFQKAELGRIITTQGSDSPTVDHRGNIWFSMNMMGIGYYTPSLRGRGSKILTVRDGLPSWNCQTLHAAADGSVWFGFADQGVVRYEKDSIVSYTTSDGFVGDQVNDICTSSDGIVWFATDKGICRFASRSAFARFGRPDGVPSMSIRASLAARDGTVWFGQSAGNDPDVLFRRGWQENGLVRYNANGFHGATNTPVNKIKYAPDGSIWFATPNAVGESGGVRRLESGQWTFFRKGMPTGLVLDMDFEKGGPIWFAHGAEGVSRYDPKTAHLGERAFEVFSLKSTRLTAPVISILHTKDGSTWLGSSGGGISRRKDGRFTHYGSTEDFLAGQVRDMLQTPDGTIWLATEIGAIRYDGKNFEIFDRGKGRLINNDVLSIFRDSSETLWFGTRAGVTRFDGHAWSSLDSLDWGLGKEVRTICQDKEGNYWFGTDQGIVRYTPGKSKPNPPILSLQTDKRYEDISAIPPILIGTQVTFYFNTINTIQRVEARRYRYQIIRGEKVGESSALNDQWVYPGQESQAQWQAAEAGSFTMVAQYMDRDLNYSTPTLVHLKIVPFWYSNPWITVPLASALFCMLGIGTQVGVQYFRKRREADGLRKQILDQDLESRRALETKALALAESNHQLDLAREAAEGARAHADSANQSKSQFLANMSHELRTPLNAIIGYSEMLQEEAEDLGTPEIKPDLQKINGAGKHLLGLINDILDLSKIEAGKMTLYLETFDVRVVLDEVAAMVQPLITKNGNQLTLEVALEIGSMRADVTKVRQTLFNLLSNASKFTDKGAITLRARREGANMVFDVIDSGIGMTPEQVGRLFQAFAQADASTSKKYGGTGLGLALSRKFCQLMGGDMTVVSEAGKGSTFTATIAAEVKEVSADSAPTEPSAPEKSVATTNSGSLVLVIDDDATVRDLLRRSLSRDGFRVETANDGASGLARARELQPAIITLDVMMPGMDGWEVLGALKADPMTADVPVIVMSIVDEKGLGFSLGAADYLTKPLDYSRLSSVVNRHAQGGRGQRVLVVEDDPATQELVTKHMSKDGWKVITADNGRTALDRVSEGKPDLVLLDLMMPEMDGFEFLEAFRKQPGCAQITVVVITAKILTPAEHQRLRGQVAQIVAKANLSPEMLAAEIRSALGKTLPQP